MLETHFAGIITEKRHNFDPSTPPTSAENLHFTLNGETSSTPRPPVASTQMPWEDADQVSFAVHSTPQTSLGQNSIAPWTDQPPPREKKRN
jgi:hypothetical protein